MPTGPWSVEDKELVDRWLVLPLVCCPQLFYQRALASILVLNFEHFLSNLLLLQMLLFAFLPLFVKRYLAILDTRVCDVVHPINTRIAVSGHYDLNLRSNDPIPASINTT